MANDLLEVVSLQAKKDLIELNAGLEKIASQINSINAKKINLPSDARAVSGQSAQAMAAINTQRERALRAIERERLAEIKLQQQREKAFDSYERNLKKEEAALARAQSLYSKVQAKLNTLGTEYRDLSAKKEIGIRLTESEAKRYEFLQGRIQNYDKVLKSVDASMGRHQRNVGNYASGFNPLSNAIGQFAREAPNAAQSFQIFAMSIGNNIGQLQDAITGLKATNAQLIAQGQPVKSVFSQVVSSIFSLNTGLYVAIALFISYSKEIGEFTSKLFSGAKAVDAIKESQTQLAQISKEAAKSIVQERLELQTNLAVARDTTLSLKEREIAAQNVLNQYPYWFESLGKEAIMNGDVEKAVRGVTDALLARALATAAENKIVENQSKFIDLEEQRLSIIAKIEKAEERLATVRRRSYAASEAERGFEQETLALGELQSLIRDLNNVVKEQVSLEVINQRLTSYSIAQSKEAIGLDYKKAEATKKAKEEEIIGETNSRDAFERNIRLLEHRLSLINKENAAYGILNAQLEIIKAAYEQLYGAQKESNDEIENTIKYGTADYYTDIINRLKEERDGYADTTDQYKMYNRAIEENQRALDELTGKKEDVKALNDELMKFFQTITSGQLNELGFGSLNTFFDGTFAKLMEQADTAQERFALMFNGITSVAQDAYKFLQQNQQAYFDAQYANLDRERDIRLGFAKGNAEAEAEINRQYEEERREIRIRELKAQKEQAIFNAVLNTAQGVTAALGQANIPLSIIIGLLGAAQIALISARQIPQFKDGVDNFKGGLAVVGDGGRSEIIKTADGQLFKTPATDTLVNLPKGASVFKSEDDFIRRSGSLLGGVPNIQLEGGKLSKADMQDVMKETLGSIKTVNTTWDANGVRTWIGTQGAKTSHLNNVVKIKGINV